MHLGSFAFSVSNIPYLSKAKTHGKTSMLHFIIDHGTPGPTYSARPGRGNPWRVGSIAAREPESIPDAIAPPVW